MCTMYIHEPVCFRVWFFPFYKYFLYFPLPRFSPDSINVGPFNLQNNQSQYGKEKRKHTVPNRTSFLSPLSLSPTASPNPTSSTTPTTSRVFHSLNFDSFLIPQLL